MLAQAPVGSVREFRRWCACTPEVIKVSKAKAAARWAKEFIDMLVLLV